MAGRRRRPRRIHPRVQPRTPPGALPGTLVVDPRAPRPTIRVLAYGPDDYTERSITDLDEVPGLLERWPVVWVCVEGLGDAHTIEHVGRIFGFHELALEDVANTLQRARSTITANTSSWKAESSASTSEFTRSRSAFFSAATTW